MSKVLEALRCCCCKRPPPPEEPPDGLVPVWFYFCAESLPERQDSITEQLGTINKQIQDYMIRLMYPKRFPDNDEITMPKASELPTETVCLVGLWDSNMEFKSEGMDHEGAEKVGHVKVKLSGSLNFPPHLEPRNPCLANAKLNKPAENDPRWWLLFSVMATVHVDMGGGEGVNTIVPTVPAKSPISPVSSPSSRPSRPPMETFKASTSLKVSCQDLQIRREVTVGEHTTGDIKGDPMIESWMNREELLKEITKQVNDNLHRVVQEIGDKYEKQKDMERKAAERERRQRCKCCARRRKKKDQLQGSVIDQA